MPRRLLDYDPDTGVTLYHTYDYHTKETTIETVQDVEHFLERNRYMQNEEQGGALGLNSRSKQQIKEGWWHVASIPIGVQYKWLAEYGIKLGTKEGDARAMKLLDDPEWKYLRTNPGRIT